VTSQNEVLVAVITGVFEVVVALIALFGPLATGSDRSSTVPIDGAQGAVSSAPSAGAVCTSVIREYRTLIRLDPELLALLTKAKPGDVPPIEVDPDARRCGIDSEVLEAMR
jgi:hypothetical protein